MAQRITAFDVFLLVSLAVLWGSAFVVLKIAVETMPPVTLAAGRVVLAALPILAYMQATGRRFPRDPAFWRWCLLAAFCGTVLPFSLIAWGQRAVDSAVSAICMASVPLFTLPLAHLFTRDEKMTRRKILGVGIGFLGIALLFKSDASFETELNVATALGIAAILAGAFTYATETLILRRLRGVDSVTLAASVLSIGATILTLASLAIDRSWTLSFSAADVGLIVFLGLFPTALATLVLVKLVARAGATFTSLNNYLVPPVGAVCGVLILGETIADTAIAAFVLIVIGLFITTRQPPAPSAPAPVPSEEDTRI